MAKFVVLNSFDPKNILMWYIQLLSEFSHVHVALCRLSKFREKHQKHTYVLPFNHSLQYAAQNYSRGSLGSPSLLLFHTSRLLFEMLPFDKYLFNAVRFVKQRHCGRCILRNKSRTLTDAVQLALITGPLLIDELAWNIANIIFAPSFLTHSLLLHT